MRNWSCRCNASSLVRLYHPISLKSPYDKFNIADIGDCPVNPADLQDSLLKIENFYKKIYESKTIPLSIGGDHLIRLPILRGLKNEKPLGRFVGLDIYLDRGHLAFEQVKDHWNNSKDLVSFFSLISDLPFYKAIFFTLTFTFTVTPIMLVLGLLIALGVNSINKLLKGLIIFF